jgi:hypothetical protein
MKWRKAETRNRKLGSGQGADGMVGSRIQRLQRDWGLEVGEYHDPFSSDELLLLINLLVFNCAAWPSSSLIAVRDLQPQCLKLE